MEVRVPIPNKGALRRWHALEPLEGFLFQRFPVVWVRYVDECMGPLADALAKQRGDSVLCNDIVGVGTGRDDAGTLLDVGADLAHALGGLRGHGQDGLALSVLADCRSSQEV